MDKDAERSTQPIKSGLARTSLIAIAVWSLWAVVLLAIYYKQIWRLFALGRSAWMAQNRSLHVLWTLRDLVTQGPAAWRLPAFGEALGRGLAGLFGAGVVLLAAYVLGVGAGRLLRWQPDDWREGLLYRLAIGLGVLSYLSLALAALGLYVPASVQLLIGTVLAGGALWFLLRRLRSGSGRHRAPAGPEPASARRPWDRVWQAIALVGVLIALVGALAPEIGHDALWYHLWLPKLWLDQGQPVDVVTEFISLYPLTWELVFGAGLVVGGPIAAKLLHFVCLPLTGLLVYQLTRRFVPQASPWLAVALFAAIPTVLWEATTANADLAFTWYVGLVVYALLRYVDGRSRPWFALAVVSLGLALAIKHLGLFVLLLATAGLALRLWLDERNLRRALAPPLLLGFLALLFPLPWYLRSWLASGNPVFPDLYVIFGASPPERWNAASEGAWRAWEAHFGRPRTVINQIRLPWDLSVHGALYDGSFGPLFLLLLPALALWPRCPGAIGWLLAFVLAYVGLWSSPLNGLEMRFLVPLAPFLVVLAAAASARLGALFQHSLGTWGEGAFQAGLAVLLLLNLPPFTSLHETDRAGSDGVLANVVHRVPIGVVLGSESEEDYLVRSVPSYGAWRYINGHLPGDARVLTFGGGDHFYRERPALGSDATLAQPALWSSGFGQEDRAFRALMDLGITHVLFDTQLLASLRPGTLAITQLPILESGVTLEYADRQFALYRLQWDQILPQLADHLVSSPPVTQEIRYHVDGASEVILVWGIGGWATVPEDRRPAGTWVQDGLMHTPLMHQGDYYLVQLQLRPGASLNYGFLVTVEEQGAEPAVVWDGDYQALVTEGGVIDVQAAGGLP